MNIDGTMDWFGSATVDWWGTTVEPMYELNEYEE